MVSDSTIDVFGRGLLDFFSKLSSVEFNLGSPVILEDMETAVFDYTASITLSGDYSGKVSFSASRQMLQAVLSELNHGQASELELVDLVGEIANGVVGCAQQHSQCRFYPSPPQISTNLADTLDPMPFDKVLVADNQQAHCIELTWNGYSAKLVSHVKSSTVKNPRSLNGYDFCE